MPAVASAEGDSIMTRDQRRAAMRTWTDATLIHWGVQFERTVRTQPDKDRSAFFAYDDVRQVCCERQLITELDAAVATAAADDRAEAERLAAMREDMLRPTKKDGAS